MRICDIVRLAAIRGDDYFLIDDMNACIRITRERALVCLLACVGCPQAQLAREFAAFGYDLAVSPALRVFSADEWREVVDRIWDEARSKRKAVVNIAMEMAALIAS